MIHAQIVFFSDQLHSKVSSAKIAIIVFISLRIVRLVLIKFNVFLIIDESAPVTAPPLCVLLSINNNAKNNHVILGIPIHTWPRGSSLPDDLKLTTNRREREKNVWKITQYALCLVLLSPSLLLCVALALPKHYHHYRAWVHREWEPKNALSKLRLFVWMWTICCMSSIDIDGQGRALTHAIILASELIAVRTSKINDVSESKLQQQPHDHPKFRRVAHTSQNNIITKLHFHCDHPFADAQWSLMNTLGRQMNGASSCTSERRVSALHDARDTIEKRKKPHPTKTH